MQPEPVPMSAMRRPSPLSRLLAAGADFAEGEAIESDFNYVFGFGAGNQDVGRDFKFEAPKFLLAGEMLRGFAGGAAAIRAKNLPFLLGAIILFGMGVEPGAILRVARGAEVVRRRA